ncbi:MOS1T transposase, partial [Pseudoatta argentina]
MSKFVPDKVFLRGVLLHYFNMNKSAAEAHRILVDVYSEHALAEQTCRKWFERFKAGDFDLDDKERPGQEDNNLQALLNENSCQTLKELSTSLEVDFSTIGKRLKSLDMIQKEGHWVPYELKPRDIERRFLTCKLLLQRQKRKGFLHRIVTGDEKWIHYDNPKRDEQFFRRGIHSLPERWSKVVQSDGKYFH